MGNVRDILQIKGTGPSVLTIGPQASALDAAVLMNDHKVGSLLVTEAGAVVGIVTERDLMRRVLAERRDPVQVKINEIMTAELLCCRPHTSVDEARGVMKNHRIRHLPVVDEDGALHGMISIGDLNAFETNSHEQTIHMLTAYINGWTT